MADYGTVGASTGYHSTCPINEGSRMVTAQSPAHTPATTRANYLALYLLALLASISIWFLAIRAPLWLDETGTYWMISGGLHRIWAYRILDLIFPTYSYLLWAWTRIFGHSVVVLRSFSILAMLGAASLLYLAARRLFNRETALIAAFLFCLHPITIYEAVDVRPYAFVALAASLSIWLLLRLRHSRSLTLAALFGISVALPIWFHTLAATFAPAMLVAFFLVKSGSRRDLWRQLAVSLAAFTVAFLPLIPGILYLLHTGKSHVFEPPPTLYSLFWTLAPGGLPFVYSVFATVALIVVALKPRNATPAPRPAEPFPPTRSLLICATIGLIPVLILYGVSATTSIHTFVSRHRMDAIPGIALLSAWLVSRFRPSVLRPLFCLALAALTLNAYWNSPLARDHNYTWKYALQSVETQAAPTHSPVLICSDYPEADYARLPPGPANNSRFLAQLSYYKLTVPAYVLPRSLTPAALRIGSRFLQSAAEARHSFFALGHDASYPVLDWLSTQAAANFTVHKIGIYDGVKVLEFTPRPAPEPAQKTARILVKPLPALTH